MHLVLTSLHSVQVAQEEVTVPVPVVRPREEVIDEEHDYLFAADAVSLQAPEWSLAACRGVEGGVRDGI